ASTLIDSDPNPDQTAPEDPNEKCESADEGPKGLHEAFTDPNVTSENPDDWAGLPNEMLGDGITPPENPNEVPGDPNMPGLEVDNGHHLQAVSQKGGAQQSVGQRQVLRLLAPHSNWKSAILFHSIINIFIHLFFFLPADISSVVDTMVSISCSLSLPDRRVLVRRQRGVEKNLVAYLGAVGHKAIDEGLAVTEEPVQLGRGLDKWGRGGVKLLPLHRDRAAPGTGHAPHLRGDLSKRTTPV
ncbi:hypothetical protein JZ751_028168, partial [Albula glossodonta]